MEKNKVMMFIIIALLVVLLGTTVGLGFVLMKSFKAKSENGTNTEFVESKSLKQNEIEVIKLSDPVTTNLAVGASGESNNMAKINIGIGVDKTQKKESEEFIELVSEKEIVIRDTVLKIMGSKTREELNRNDSREIIREELLQSLQDEFESNLIVSVYIYEWTVV